MTLNRGKRFIEYLAFSCVFILIPGIANAQIFPPPSGGGGNHLTLYSDFSRTYEGEAGVDSLAGSFYYLKPGHIFFEISFPIEQILLVEDNVITIYYPKANRGFILQGKVPAILPMVPSVLAAVRPDYGLTNLGYEIYNQEMKNDTLLTYWHHPVGGEDLGQFRLARVGEQLAYAAYQPLDGTGEIWTFMEAFQIVDGYIFPTKLRTENRSVLSFGEEKLELFKIKVNPEVPPSIANFTIPDDADVEYRQY